MKLNIPNILSLLRVIIAPFFFLLIISGSKIAIGYACVLFLIGAISDYLDGWLARKYQETTAWGTFVDPLADKILTTSAFLSFVVLKIIPLWMVLIIVIRDFSTTYLRIYADSVQKPLVTSKSAKWKTTIQMFFIAYIIVLLFTSSLESDKAFTYSIKSMIYSDITYYSFLVLTLLSTWTLAEYFLQNRIVINQIWCGFSKKKICE